MTIASFPKVLHLGSVGSEHLFDNEIEITEKLDGSQWSVGKVDGQLYMRSKGAEVYPEAPQQMFQNAVDWSLKVADKIPNNIVIHGEFLRAPKHNALRYDSIPKNGFAIFGVRTLPENKFIDYDELVWWSEKLDCDVVPLLGAGKFEHDELVDKIKEWLTTESKLGGPNIEGVVIKNYEQTGLVGGQVLPILCCKYVREDFKEVNKSNWKKDNPGTLERLAAAFSTEARWEKAVNYLRDCGELEYAPKDIGKLLKRVQQDLEEEEKEEIKIKLYEVFRKDIMRIATKNIAIWYKEKLLRGEVEPSK